jgi:hypothetical protein
MRQRCEPILTSGRGVVAGVTLGSLAISQAMVGVWALLAPSGFFRGFPAAGHPWVALLPPYNEHLVLDLGALNLSLTVLLLAAAVMRSHSMVRVAVTAYAVYAIPHTVFHGLHLHGFPAPDAVAQMAGFGAQILVAALALATTFPSAGPQPWHKEARSGARGSAEPPATAR